MALRGTDAEGLAASEATVISYELQSWDAVEMRLVEQAGEVTSW